MRLRRRPFLALLAGCVAGCGGRGGGSTPADRATPQPTQSAGTESSATTQSLSVGNSHATAEFVTVAVADGDRTVFVESRELVPGERRTFGRVPLASGVYAVIVETGAGSRATYRWHVDDALDGLSVTLAAGIDVVRTARCAGGCPLQTDGTGITPLVGDGSGRWYAPARIVLTNPKAETTASLAVELDDETLVDARYRLPRDTQVVVPLTYRTGTYRVTVETPVGRVAGEWQVPEEPSRVVDVSTLKVGCGPANTELRLENADDRRHTVGVDVERGGTRRFRATYTLDAGARQAVVPVDESGRYDVRICLDGEAATTRAWWACPPHGPATVVVDATGRVTLRQAGQ
jgi:hypothetical protein